MPEKKNRQWLHRELPLWVERQFISQQQADQLARSYPLADSQISRSIFSVLGAILFGLGIILFFAYNWQDMHRMLKLAVIFVCIIAANLGALWFDAASSQRHAAGEGLSLLGTMLFGAAIWLIAQIYHIDEHYPNAFMLWGLGALAMGWARRSSVQCLVAIMLLFAWGCLEVFTFQLPYHSSPWWLLLGTASLAWLLRSAWLLFLSVSAFYFLWMMNLLQPLDDTAGYVILAVSVLLVQIGMLSSRLGRVLRWPARDALAIPGFLVYLGIVFAVTFVHFVDQRTHLDLFETTVQSRFFWGSMIISMTMPLLALLPLRNTGKLAETDLLHTMLMLLSIVLIFLVGPGWLDLSYDVLAGMMNLIFIGHCFLFILHGSQQQRAWEVAGGCLLFAALVFARYADLFDSLLSRSLVFLVLGASLFVVGNFYARQKKIARFAKDDQAMPAQGGQA